MQEETQKHLLAQIQENFKTFGAGQQFKSANKTALALEDEPLCFAAGVDVAEVIKFVLHQAQVIGRGHREINGVIAKIKAIADMGEFSDEGSLRADSKLIAKICADSQ